MAATTARLERRPVIDLDAPRPPVRPITDSPTTDPVALRDHLTRTHLAGGPDGPEAGEVARFRRQWWDGAAWVPTLVVRSPRGRYRLTASAGSVTALPANPWRARRALARLRRPAVCDPALAELADRRGVPSQRSQLSIIDLRADVPSDPPTPPVVDIRTDAPRRIVHIDAPADGIRCRDPRCSALVPIPPPGRLADIPTCRACGCVI